MKRDVSIKVIGLMLLFLVTSGQPIRAEEDDPLRGWEMWTAGGAKVTFEADTTIFRSGKGSLKTTNKSPFGPDVYGNISQGVAVQPDTAYRLRVFVKAKNFRTAFFTVRADWGDRQYLPDGTYDWYLVEYDFVTGEDQTYLVLRLITENITEALWIDDIEIVEYGTTKNLIFNGGFERGKRK